MGNKSYYKNRIHIALILALLFPLINLIKHANADILSTETNTSVSVECVYNSSCGLSDQSRSVDTIKNNTVLYDITDGGNAVEKDSNGTDDGVLRITEIIQTTPAEVNDEPSYSVDIMEGEVLEPSEEDFKTLLDYGDYTTESYITSTNYFDSGTTNIPLTTGKHGGFGGQRDTLFDPVKENENIEDSAENSSKKSDTSLGINTVYIKNLDKNMAKNITETLLKKLDVEDKNITNKVKNRTTRQKGSLAFVFDATGSMWNDLVSLRKGAELILESMLDREEKPIQNYVLVPFRDPDVGPVGVSEDDTFLQRGLENLSVYGGGTCPERSLGGISAALDASHPNSFIYVFTDATAEDYNLVDTVIALVQKKHTQIVFVLTGDCNSRNSTGYKVYEDIAAASSGQIFRLEQKNDVFDVTKYVRDTLNADQVNLGSSRNPPGDHQHKLTVDGSLRQVTVAIAGSKPSIMVTDPYGKNYSGPPKIIPLLDLSDVKVVKIIDPEPGNWTFTVGSLQDHSVKLTGLSDLRFDHGFSVHATDKMSETSNRPLQGAQNILMISVDEGNKINTLTSAELVDLNGETLFEVPLKMLEKTPNEPLSFTTEPFIPPSSLFFIAANGIDKSGNPLRRISSTGVNPQLPEKPIMSVPEEITSHIHSQVLLQCKVHSLVPVNIWWFKDGVPVMKRQDHVQSATVEYLIANLDEKTAGKYVCKASNSAGHSAAYTDVILTADPPKVDMMPSDITGIQGKRVLLECVVQSQMSANVQMVFQNKNSTHRSNNEIDVGTLQQSFEGMSTIYSYEFILSPEAEGLYTCIATNKGGVTRDESSVNLLLPLKVEAFPKIMEYEKGGILSFSCTIHGSSEGKWVSSNTDVLPEESDWEVTRVVLEGGVQLFMDAKNPTKRHEGFYDCYAFRDLDIVHDTVESRYVEAPVIDFSKENVSFELDSTAIVDCFTIGIPKPDTKWFLPDGTPVLPEAEETKRIYVKGSELIINYANPVDSGKYVCEAENQFGKTKSALMLSVWKKPSLTEKLENKTLNIYESLTIPCKVSGIPLPTVSWYFDDVELSNTETLLDGKVLLLYRTDVKDAGRYTCVATNDYGVLREDVYVHVNGLEPPLVTKGNKSIIIKEGDVFHAKCRYLQGKPLPSLYWQRDGVNISDFGSAESVEENSVQTNTEIEFIVHHVTHEQEGIYSCIGVNILGEDRYDFHLEVQRPPKFLGPDEDYEDVQDADNDEDIIEATAGSKLTLNCDAVGKPKPFVTWSKDGTPVVFTNIVQTNKNNNLVITEVREIDRGTYSCVATNPVGSLQRNFTVNVLVRPTILNETSDPVLQTVEGQLVVLPCSVYAVPTPQVTWMFNKELIIPSDRMQMDSDNTLRFVANLTDSGVYKCEAINKAGNSSQDYLVLVFVPPYIYPPGNEVVKSTNGSYIVLDCHAIGFPEPNILWTKDGKSIDNSSDIVLNDSGRLNITRVTRNNSGTFICSAENYAGFSEKIFYVVLNEAPNILPSELPANVQLLAGEDEFNIPCRGSGNPKPYITWMKDGKYIINDLHTKVHSDGTLSLRLVTEDLSGKYTCQAANTEGSIEIDYNIQVIAPPSLVDSEEHSKTITAVEHSTANLECPLKHSTVMPTIQWYKNSDLIKDNVNKTVLKLVNVTRHDASEYSCLASNAGGKVSATFKLVVQWPPSFSGGNSPDQEHVHFMEGDPMKLACHVDANPAADVQWLRDLEMIGDISPILRRNFVKTHHAGEHMCVASNPHGQITKKFIVQVSAPPRIEGLENVSMEVRLGQAVRLDCAVSGYPKPDIDWTVKYTPDWDVIGDGRILKSFNVSRHSEGMYSCLAKNKAGNATKQFNITVVELPRTPIVRINITGIHDITEGVGNISLKAGTNVSILCVSSGNPPSSVMWIRNGLVLNDSEALNSTQLVLDNLHSRDAGKYTCMSKNRIGSEETDINIDVLAYPEILEDGNFEIILSNSNKTKNKWKTIEILERQSIRLNCRSQGNPVPDVYWFKDKNYMRFYDANVMTEDHGQVMVIRKVSREHGGNYTCVARNNIGEDKMNFKVDVWVSPFVEQQKDGGMMYVAKRGENVQLECPITSNPKPVIRWLKHPYFDIVKDKFPNIEIKDANSTLLLHNVTVADNGNYSCIGTNMVGMVEMLFVFEVVEAPTILEEEQDEKKSYMFPNGTVVAKIRRGFQLSCNAVAHPEPEITWYKDGFRLYNSYGADPLHLSRDGRYLNVMDASLGSAGKYVCKAQNKVGDVQKEFLVKVLVPAEWSTWSQWSECSAPCGSGQSTRRRDCHFHGDLEAVTGYSHSVLQNDQTDSVNTTGKTLNEDNSTKADDQRLREAKLTNKSSWKVPEDMLDKSACRGNHTESRECFIVPCKVDGGWSSWGEWTSCSVLCGAGSRRRYRSCSAPRPQYGGAGCAGADAQQEPCRGTNCSRWLLWSSWSECSVSCGKGLQIRTRKCDGPIETCMGTDRETRTCLLASCPVRAVWSEWSDWSPCSVTCGTGQRRRWRKCRSGVCTGGNLQIEKCLDIHNSCNKYIEGINDIYGRNGQNKRNKALLNISGKLNGFKLPSKFVEADILERNGHKYVQTSINDVLSKKDDYLPYMSFMISPKALETEKVYQNNPLASSRMRMLPSQYEDSDQDDSQIQFSTGEQVHLYHRNQGVSESGEMLVDIIIDGDIPDFVRTDKVEPVHRQPAPAMLISESKQSPLTVLTVNTCTIGYAYHEDNKQCQDVNECELPTNGCHSTQMCENLPGSYRCLCQHGFMSMGIGQRCLDLNECLHDTDGCSHDCVNTAGSFYCTCPPGLKLTGDRKTCVKEDINEWLKGFEDPEELKPTVQYTATPKPPIKVLGSNDQIDPDDEEENILLTRISPPRDKSKPVHRRTRPHRYHPIDDYDYKALSPIDEDEYTDNNDGKGQQRISKQSKWSQPPVTIVDDDKDTYEPLEKKKNGTEQKITHLAGLDSFINLKNSDKKQNTSDGDDRNEKRKVAEIKLVEKAFNIGSRENSYEDDDSYEDEDSYSKLFNDTCPEGYHSDNNKCNDIDECAMNMNSCNGVINMCINTRGSYACVPTACPDSYERNANGSCDQRCDVRDIVCSEGAALRQNIVFIIISTSIHESLLPGSVLYLNHGGKINNTVYKLERQPQGETFYVTTDDKVGILHTLMVPSLKRINRIIISGKGFDEKGNKLLYYTKFIIYLYIWE